MYGIGGLISPKHQIKYFTIRGTTPKYYPNTYIISPSKILYKFEHYDRISMEFTRCLYVQTHYQIIMGVQHWKNGSSYTNHNYHTYKIISEFNSKQAAYKDYKALDKKTIFQSSRNWVLWEEPEQQAKRFTEVSSRQQASNEQHKKYLYEASSTDEQDLPINTPLGPDGQLGKFVVGKSEDHYTQHLSTEHTNNLGVTFRIRCQNLNSWVKWFKYEGKIYRAVLYHTNAFQVMNSKGEYKGFNYITKSKFINKESNVLGVKASDSQMKMRRIWIVDEQLGGLSVRQYRRLRRKINNTFKDAYMDRSLLNPPFTKEYTLDPSLHLFLDEVLKDIAEEEKHQI